MKSGSLAEKSDKGRGRGRQREKSANPVGNRILAGLAGRTRKWLAGETGIPESTISDFIRDGIAKSEPALMVAQALGVSLEWLLTGQGDLDPPTKVAAEAGAGTGTIGRQLSSSGSDNDDDQVDIASIDFAYGFGGAFLDVGDADVQRVRFSRAWLRERGIYAPPEVLGVAQGIGDSMEPVLYDRDLVFFDRSARLEEHVSDKMWVFAYGQVGMVKRLRPMPDGTVKIMSANRTYPDEIASDGELHIIGRVVGSWRSY
jgi:phage repressor protein C with HTH and peptisase S24 domain